MEAMNDNQVVVGSNEQEEIDGNVDVNHSHGEEEEERIYAHKESNRITEEVSLRITPLVVLGFVCCMCTLLVLLYFFYDQLGKVSSIVFLMIYANSRLRDSPFSSMNHATSNLRVLSICAKIRQIEVR